VTRAAAREPGSPGARGKLSLYTRAQEVLNGDKREAHSPEAGGPPSHSESSSDLPCTQDM